MSLQPGQTVAHYELLELIGEGGMGRVFRAYDSRLKRQVAIKILQPGLTSDEKLRRRFEREARAAAAVSHPTIAAIHEVSESGDLAYIVMEYVEGRTLKKMLGAGPVPLMETLRIAVEIAEGLGEAHRAGVVHRDLKPDNIIVRPDRRPKILDFGIAKLLEDQSGMFRRRTRPSTTSLSSDGKIMGTLGYMSPEQARGDPVDARTDIFSLGVILYEMVTGQAPFRGRTPIDTLTSILKEPPLPATQVNPAVHPRVEQLLEECLQKDPAKRFQRMEDLVASLRIAQLALQEAAMRRTTFEGPAIREPVAGARKPAPRARRLPSILLWAIAALVLAGTLSALYLRGQASPPPAGGSPAAGRAESGVKAGTGRERPSDVARALTRSSEAYQHYAAGELALHEARWNEAIARLESATGIDPTFALAHYHLAIARSWGGDPDGSLPALQAGLPHADRLPEPWRTLYHAQLQWRRQEAGAAYDALSGLVKRHPDTADAWYLLAEIHEHSSRHWSPARSREYFQRALDLDSSFRLVFHHLVYDHLAAEDVASARRLISKHDSELEKDAAEEEAELAIRFAEGRMEEALRVGDAALGRGHDSLRLILATAHLAAGHPQRAAELSTRAAPAGGSEPPSAILTRAWVLAQVGRLTEALDAFREAHSKLAGTVFIRFGAFSAVSSAQLLDAAGDRAAAISSARDGLLTDPHYAPAYYWLGRLQLAGGEMVEARKTLGTLRERMSEVVPDPALFWVLALQAEINREEGDLGAALAALGRAAELPPESRNPEVGAFTGARVKAAFGDLDGAIAAYREGLRPIVREPWNDRVSTPVALYDLAILAERAGQADAARGHLRQFLAAWGEADLPVAAVADAKRRLATAAR